MKLDEETTMTWEQQLWAASFPQLLQLNPEAALQKAIFADNFVPVGNEYRDLGPDDVYRAAQAAEHLETGERRVYYANVPIWNAVSWIGAPPAPGPQPGATIIDVSYWQARSVQ